MTHHTHTYRLVTRSDFDGLVSAALLRELGMLDEIVFVHPKDMQDGQIAITDHDIITNLPFVSGCHLCFDHHDSEAVRNSRSMEANLILDPQAESAARVVYSYFGGAKRFPNISQELMAAVDRTDVAGFSREEILAPEGWALLAFVMDPRTGLGRFRDFTVSNYELMLELIDPCRHNTIDEILAIPDVQERIEVYNDQRQQFCEQIARCSGVFGNVAVLDLRDEKVIYAGNRFLIYAVLPQTNVSVTIAHGRILNTTMVAIGKSILNQTNPVKVGELCLKYGGGGHDAAGTCQIPVDEVDRLLPEIIEQLDESTWVTELMPTEEFECSEA